MFSSLPLELLYKIGDNVPRMEDKKSLRRTCSLLGRALRAHVLAEVTLNIHNDNLESGINLLQTLVDEAKLKSETGVQSTPGNATPISKYIRALHIESLSPSFAPESDSDLEQRLSKFRYTYEAEEEARSWVKTELQELESVSKAEERLRSLLEPALMSLHNLVTVRWCWHWKDSEWTFNAVSASLLALGGHGELKELMFHYSPSEGNEDVLTFLPSLSGLHTLSINATGVTERVFTSLMESLIVANDASLTALHLSIKTVLPVPLRRTISSTILNLGLGGFAFIITQIVHSNLTSLDLGSRCSPTPSYDELWRTLSRENIHLRSLVAFDTTNALLEYIQSYSGLEELSLVGPWRYTHRLYDDAAEHFYRHALPMHYDTLVKLGIKPAFESKWCFDVDNLGVFQKCRKLRSLWVKVDHRGLEPDPARPLPRPKPAT